MQKSVLVIGATGYLGGKVVDHLLQQQVKVHAFVREGSDARSLVQKNVVVVNGDLTRADTILPALKSMDAVVSTAIGYAYRRKGDSIKSVDENGNRNLVDALKQAEIKRFVFTSILTADKAQAVPHFWQKKLIEDYMDKMQLPYIALRPGAFLDQNPLTDHYAKGLLKGKLQVLGTTKTKWTNILTDDLARYLATAAIDERIPFGKMDIGMKEPMNAEMLAKLASAYTGQEIKASAIPWSIIGTVFSIAGIFKPQMADMKKMFDYFFTGQYIADTTSQHSYFGEVPSVQDSVFRYCRQIGLAQKSDRKL
jgi:uncharacterized protein YbjT (DUF2867 family)